MGAWYSAALPSQSPGVTPMQLAINPFWTNANERDARIAKWDKLIIAKDAKQRRLEQKQLKEKRP